MESFFFQFARGSARKGLFSAESDDKTNWDRSRGSVFMTQSWRSDVSCGRGCRGRGKAIRHMNFYTS